MRKLKHQAKPPEEFLKIWHQTSRNTWRKKSSHRVYAASFESVSKDGQLEAKNCNFNYHDEVKELFKSCCDLRKSETPQKILEKALELLKRNDEALIIPAINVLRKVLNENVQLETTFQVLLETWNKYRWSQIAILKLLSKLPESQAGIFFKSSLFFIILSFSSANSSIWSSCLSHLFELMPESKKIDILKKFGSIVEPLINLSN